MAGEESATRNGVPIRFKCVPMLKNLWTDEKN